MKSTYDISKSYDWNYEHGPIYTRPKPKVITIKKIKLWDQVINSPIGIPAGPLLNSKYIKLYSELAFDIPVYKTVRTCFRNAHSAPNCLYLNSTQQIKATEMNTTIYAREREPERIEDISITNSFGMPSKEIDTWQQDIQIANNSMGNGQLMIVSCTGTPSDKRDIIEDYVYCAQLAVEAGAKAIELNYSCPNVTSKEGSIYQDPLLSSKISQAVKSAIPNTPLMIKIGYIKKDKDLYNIINSNSKYIDGVAAINTIPMQARKLNNEQALPGVGRLNSGVCGNIIRNIGLETISRIAEIKKKGHFDFILCGVGGITTPQHFDDYLMAGADIVMSATGAMWNPHLAIDWRKQLIKG